MDDRGALAAVWERFAERECRGYSPLYERISRSVATNADLLGLVDGMPSPARQPNLLLAAVHYLLLSGVAHPLADVYRGVSSADPAPLFRDFCVKHREEVQAVVTARRTQTNECGRSAVIVPALRWAAVQLGEPVALLDVGASAGINLLCDEFRIDYGPAGATGPLDSSVQIDCRVVAGQPPVWDRAPVIASRRGIDRAPVDLHDPDQVRWLLACVWPDTGRLERTQAAIELARRHHVRVDVGDAVGDLAGAVATLPEQAIGCVTTTWVAAYLSPAERTAFVDVLASAASRRPIVWISAEGPRVIDLFDAGEPPMHDDTSPSLLGAVLFDRTGATVTTLGWVHPHGRWIDGRFPS